MTTLAQKSDYSILLFLLRNKSFRPIANQYKLNYNCISVLVGLYLHASISSNKGILITHLAKFLLYYYTTQQIRIYLDKLISFDLVVSKNRLYYLTELGYSAINIIQQRSESLVYDFCNRYGIEL
jgi:hypothetical protein